VADIIKITYVRGKKTFFPLENIVITQNVRSHDTSLILIGNT